MKKPNTSLSNRILLSEKTKDKQGIEVDS